MNIYKVNYSFANLKGEMRNGALLLPGKDVEEVHIKATKQLSGSNLLYPSINNITLYRGEEETKKK